MLVKWNALYTKFFLGIHYKVTQRSLTNAHLSLDLCIVLMGLFEPNITSVVVSLCSKMSNHHKLPLVARFGVNMNFWSQGLLEVRRVIDCSIRWGSKKRVCSTYKKARWTYSQVWVAVSLLISNILLIFNAKLYHWSRKPLRLNNTKDQTIRRCISSSC